MPANTVAASALDTDASGAQQMLTQMQTASPVNDVDVDVDVDWVSAFFGDEAEGKPAPPVSAPRRLSLEAPLASSDASAAATACSQPTGPSSARDLFGGSDMLDGLFPVRPNPLLQRPGAVSVTSFLSGECQPQPHHAELVRQNSDRAQYSSQSLASKVSFSSAPSGSRLHSSYASGCVSPISWNTVHVPNENEPPSGHCSVQLPDVRVLLLHQSFCIIMPTRIASSIVRLSTIGNAQDGEPIE